ncbi:MAG: hypothetical protein RR630_04070 [Coprobacillus sp.]
MKKIILLLCCCLLCGCQNQSHSTASTSQQKEDLIFKPWHLIMKKGDGNEEGYYHIKEKETTEGTVFNICYYDYATKKEIILCNKPECQHNDETCTACLMSGITSQLIVYNDSLYIMESRGLTVDSLGQRQETGPKIIKRNLDGSQPQDVHVLEDGYQFDDTSYVIADDILYIKISKQELYKIDKSSSMQVDIEKKLYAINLKTGEGKSILDLMNKDIIGVNGRNLIIKHTLYKEDPMKYLEEGNYSKYDQITFNSSVGYSILDIDTLKDSEILNTDLEGSYYYNGYIYSTEKDGIYSLNVSNRDKKKLISYNKNLSYNLNGIYDGYILLDEYKEDVDYTFISSYIISLDDPKMEKLSFVTRSPKQPVEIISETKDSFLVKYDREGHMEKSWAGTDQYEETKQYIGLIKKTDYFENKANYQNIELLK